MTICFEASQQCWALLFDHTLERGRDFHAASSPRAISLSILRRRTCRLNNALSTWKAIFSRTAGHYGTRVWENRHVWRRQWYSPYMSGDVAQTSHSLIIASFTQAKSSQCSARKAGESVMKALDKELSRRNRRSCSVVFRLLRQKLPLMFIR